MAKQNQRMMTQLAEMLQKYDEGSRRHQEMVCRFVVSQATPVPRGAFSILEPWEIYLVKPTSRTDRQSASLFVACINSAKPFTEQLEKMPNVLLRCLDNDVAADWFTTLQNKERYSLTQSPDHWTKVLKRDFIN
jgi:hypothetical protein